jgi:non-canonical purine NTP pyrophosphatase (RdgB/HAM1 family)
MKVLIATGNLSKIAIYSVIFKKFNIETISLRDINININVEENGKDELENAIIKAKAYFEAAKIPVLANDSGLIIDKFKPEDQPGQFVRRYNGKELTDQELLDLYIEKLNAVGGESSGHLNVALAIIDQNGKLHTKMFYPKWYFINTPSSKMVKGAPLNSIAIDPKTKKYLCEMTPEEKNEFEAEEMKKQEEFIKSVFCK